ncbi:hypothetical protein PLESTF_000050100 [Pleodorina starrii]|nr:hypothetical protein PLESTF_000050100 [Pleodorina starrii]
MPRSCAGSSQVTRLRKALADARAEMERLRTEVSANDSVLAEAESALVVLVGEKEALERKLDGARASERLAAETTEGLRMQVASLQARLGPPSASPSALEPEASSGVSYDRMVNYLDSLGDDASTRHASHDGAPFQTNASTPIASPKPGPRFTSPEHVARSSGWDNSAAAGSLGGGAAAAVATVTPAAPSRMLLALQESMGRGQRGGGSALPSPNASPLGDTARAGRPESHTPAGPAEPAAGANGLASAAGKLSTSIRSVEQGLAAGTRLTVDTAFAADAGDTPNLSPRGNLEQQLSGGSAAGLVIRARAFWATAAANATAPRTAGAASLPSRDGPPSPLSPRGLRSPRSPILSPMSSSAAVAAPGTADGFSPTGAERLTDAANQHRGRTASLVTPQPMRVRLSSYNSHPPSSPTATADGTSTPNSAVSRAAHAPSGLTSSVFVARPAAAADASAALHTAFFRLTPGNSLSNPRVSALERIEDVLTNPLNSGDRSRSVSIGGSAGGSGGPMVSPRGAIAGRSISRAVDHVAKALVSPSHSGSHEQIVESASGSPTHFQRLGLAAAVGGAVAMTAGASGPQAADVPRSWPVAGAGAPLVAATPARSAITLGFAAAPAPSSVGGRLTAAPHTDSLGQRPTPFFERAPTGVDGYNPVRQADYREVTPASLRRAAGQDEGSSVLAMRLSAMEDALRAIGAA